MRKRLTCSRAFHYFRSRNFGLHSTFLSNDCSSESCTRHYIIYFALLLQKKGQSIILQLDSMTVQWLNGGSDILFTTELILLRIAYTRLVDLGLPSENGFLSLREIYVFRFLCLSLTIIPRTLGIKQTTGLFSQKTFKKQRKPRYQVLLSALGQSKEKSLILLPRLKNM